MNGGNRSASDEKPLPAGRIDGTSKKMVKYAVKAWDVRETAVTSFRESHGNMATQLFYLLLAAGTLLFGSCAQAAEVGQTAPNCRFAPLDGQPGHDLQKYRGKVVYVDFWASWCGPCAQSFPFMSQLNRDLGKRGLQVVGVNVDEDPEEAKAFLSKHPAGFSVVADENGKCPMDFGVRAMPSSYLIDRQGMIRHVHLGFRPGEAEKTRALLEQLLAEPAR